MKLWELACKYVKPLYWIMFFVGILLLILSLTFKVISWQSLLSPFPAAAGITAAYLWMRLDVWRSDGTIENFTKLEEVVADLISRRADCRVALLLLILVSIVQFFLKKPVFNWLVSFGELCILVPLGNWFARKMENSFKRTHFGHRSA